MNNKLRNVISYANLRFEAIIREKTNTLIYAHGLSFKTANMLVRAKLRAEFEENLSANKN